MAITEILGGLGSWELELRSTTPDHIRSQLGLYGHLVVVDGPVDVLAAGNGILAGARYVGVCRGKGKGGQLTRAGSGLLFWLGDEDGKGHTLLTEVSLTNATLAQVVTALMPPTVTVGTVHAQATPATRYTGKHQFQSRREALAIALAPFDAEIRVNPNFTIDVGTAAQLYNTEAPDRIIVRRGAGSDIDLTAVGGQVDVEEGAWDFSTDVTLLGQTVGTADVPAETFATASAAAPSVPYKDPQGNQVKFTRLISESGQTEGSVTANAQLQLNRFNRTARAVKVTAEDFVMAGRFAVGDAVYVYDPDTDIVNAANQVTFRGQVLHPDVVRVAGDTWPLLDGMTVAWRTDLGVWVDLTPWVVWESPSSGELTVGDLRKTLTKPGGNPVQDRVDAARGDTRTPKTPTGLVLSTSSSITPKGADSAVITAEWVAVTQNTDNTTAVLSHYEVQYRPTFRAPLWLASSVSADTDVDLAVMPALGYDVHVRAVSTSGKTSGWSTTESITSAADSAAPPATADPTLTNILGQIRVRYPGTNSVGGAMPADTNRVDVEVGPSASGPWTVESSLNPFVEGIHYVTAPYTVTQHVRLVPYDHNRNAGPPSAAIPAATAQLGNADIATLSVAKLIAGTMTADVTIAGRFATALTGARREVNAIGFQAFDASNNMLINLDGVNNLLTGVFKTALAGRRIEIGAAGSTGEITMYAPDGTLSFLRAHTESGGIEAVQLGVSIVGVTNSLWNRINYNNDSGGYANYRANRHEFMMGDVNGVMDDGDAGYFHVLQVPTTTGTGGTERFLVSSTNNAMVHRSAVNGGVLLESSDIKFVAYGTVGATQPRFEMTASTGYLIHGSNVGNAYFERQPSGITTFRMGTGNGYNEFHPPLASTPAMSSYLRFITGGSFAGNIHLWVDGSGQSFEFKDWQFNGFIGCRASEFEVSSDAVNKTDIVEYSGDALAKLRRIPQKQFRRLPAPGIREIRDRDGQVTVRVEVDPDRPGSRRPPEVGFIAQDVREIAPELVREAGDGTLTIGVMPTLALMMRSIGQLADRLDDLETP